MSQVPYKPEGYTTITPYLIVRDAAEAIEFYEKAFDAVERMRLPLPNGRIGHAELLINGQAFMLSDECPEMSRIRSPRTLGGSSVGMHIYVENVDAAIAQAAFAGAQVLSSPENHFYGDRGGVVCDPYGHVWLLATHIEDVPPQEMGKRAEKAMKEMAAAK